MAGFKTSRIQWKTITVAAEGMSYGDIVRACEDAIKEMIIHDKKHITHGELKKAINERQAIRGKQLPG